MAYEILKGIRSAVFGPTTEERITCSTLTPPGSTQAEPDVYMDIPFVKDMLNSEQTASESINEKVPFDPTSQQLPFDPISQQMLFDPVSQFFEPITWQFQIVISEMPLEPPIQQSNFQTTSKNLLESTGQTTIKPPSIERHFEPVDECRAPWLNSGKRIAEATGPLSEQRRFGPFSQQRPFGPFSEQTYFRPFSPQRPFGSFSQQRSLNPFSLQILFPCVHAFIDERRDGWFNRKNGWMDRMDVWMDDRKEQWMDCWMDWVDRMDDRMDGWVDGWMDRWMDRWTDRLMDRWMVRMYRMERRIHRWNDQWVDRRVQRLFGRVFGNYRWTIRAFRRDTWKKRWYDRWVVRIHRVNRLMDRLMFRCAMRIHRMVAL